MIEIIYKVVRKLSWSFIGNISYALSQWVIITLLARIGTSEELGLYSLSLAINAPIILFFNFQLRVMLATEKNDENDTFQLYFASRITHLIIAVFCVLLISLVYIYYTDSSIYAYLIILINSLYKVFESLSDICLGYLQKKNKIDLIGKSQFYRALFTIIVFGLLIYITENLLLSIIGLVAVMALRFLRFDLEQVRRITKIKPTFSVKIFTLTKLGLPLGFVSLINSLNTNIPKYFLDFFEGVSSVGVYSILAYVLIAGNLVISPISLLAAPKMTELYGIDVKKFVVFLIKLCMASTVIFLLIISFIIAKGDWILQVLYGEHFAKYHNILILLSMSLLFSFYTVFINLALVVTRSIKSQPIINLITTFFTIICGFILISWNGVLGAAITLLITRVIQTLLCTILFKINIKKHCEQVEEL